MSVQEIISRIEKERKGVAKDIYNSEGMSRLQDVMSAYEGDYKLIWSDEIVANLKDKPKPTGLMTGIQPFDVLTGGFRAQQLLTFFAHTKHGKTEIGMWLTGIFRELNPIVIPLEQNAEEIISQRMERNFAIPMFLSPARTEAFVTTEWIEERVVEGIAKHNSKMIVIDHLGYIDTNGKDGANKRENLAYRIGMVMKELKGIAKKWDVLIVLMVHVSEGDEGKPPSLQDIGNSSDIKKESDLVVGIWRKNALKKKVRVYDDKTMLSVLANRRFGKNGSVGLVFDTEKGVYYEDNAWVEAMVNAAKTEIATEDDYDGI